MKNKSNFEELLTRGVERIVERKEIEAFLHSSKKMTMYLGVDPSSPVVHLGHAVVLRKLREFQKLGHKIIFLIGDFTGQIGDPTGKDAQRQVLTHQQVLENAKTYKKQIAKILDFKNNPPQIKYNSKWLGEMKLKDVARLAAHFTVQQMLARDMFQKRIAEDKPISVLEFLYPLMQGYDSVALNVDMEVGGNDQLFNMMAGRTLMEKIKGKSKIVMTFQLLEGMDGRKMSKSYGNVIGVLDEPNDMFGKVMSLNDNLIIKYFTLATDFTLSEIEAWEKKLKSGLNPREVKAKLAGEVVKIYHGETAATKAEAAFNSRFRDKEIPDDIPEIAKAKLKSQKLKLDDLLFRCGLVSSKTEARRMVEQGAVKVAGMKMTEIKEVTITSGLIISVGKHRLIKIK